MERIATIVARQTLKRQLFVYDLARFAPDDWGDAVHPQDVLLGHETPTSYARTTGS